MKNRSLLMAALAAVILAYPAYLYCYYGVAYGSKQYSPNGAFYYQKYKLASWRNWVPTMAFPGQGSDKLYYVNGYVRVYTAAGEQIGQARASGVPVAEVHWAGDAVVVMDGSVDQADPIMLPGRSD
ncbi:hypothetical protein OR16_07219 [Cupriavidus basilensis OR16]|uniref:Uncharacterized protein n=1 Tax=Cupriavidus basilensis OR16 TaxID=1127483 RepID=H1S138_9BURK|nr:hypothetical protein [Cupriavidus basilensis]EHP43854.1 hypothetical protein OR16_07219 [Cupriavidus basilensis OR16]